MQYDVDPGSGEDDDNRMATITSGKFQAKRPLERPHKRLHDNLKSRENSRETFRSLSIIFSI